MSASSTARNATTNTSSNGPTQQNEVDDQSSTDSYPPDKRPGAVYTDNSGRQHRNSQKKHYLRGAGLEDPDDPATKPKGEMVERFQVDLGVKGLSVIELMPLRWRLCRCSFELHEWRQHSVRNL